MSANDLGFLINIGRRQGRSTARIRAYADLRPLPSTTMVCSVTLPAKRKRNLSPNITFRDTKIVSVTCSEIVFHVGAPTLCPGVETYRTLNPYPVIRTQ